LIGFEVVRLVLRPPVMRFPVTRFEVIGFEVRGSGGALLEFKILMLDAVRGGTFGAVPVFPVWSCELNMAVVILNASEPLEKGVWGT
jgi:hypothetical protein